MFRRGKWIYNNISELPEDVQAEIIIEELNHTRKKKLIRNSIAFAIAVLFAMFGLWSEKEKESKVPVVEPILTMEEFGYSGTEVTYSTYEPIKMAGQTIGYLHNSEISNPLGSADYVSSIVLEVYDINNETNADAVYEQTVMNRVDAYKNTFQYEVTFDVFLQDSYDKMVPYFYAINDNTVDSAYCIFDINNLEGMPVSNVCFIKKDNQFAYIQYSKNFELTDERVHTLFSVLERILDYRDK